MREATFALLRAQVASGASKEPASTSQPSLSPPPSASPAPPSPPAASSLRRSARNANNGNTFIALDIGDLHKKSQTSDRLFIKVFANEKELAGVTFVPADGAARDAAVKRLKEAQTAQELAEKIEAGIKTEHSDVKCDKDLNSLKAKRWLWPDAVIKAAQKLSPPVELGMLTPVKKGYDEDAKIAVQIFNEDQGKVNYDNKLRPKYNDFDVELVGPIESRVGKSLGSTALYKLRLRVPPEVAAKHGIPANASLSLGAVRLPTSTFVPRVISEERFNVTTHDTYHDWPSTSKIQDAERGRLFNSFALLFFLDGLEQYLDYDGDGIFDLQGFYDAHVIDWWVPPLEQKFRLGKGKPTVAAGGVEISFDDDPQS